MSNNSSKILVTGASGHFGGLVLKHLVETYQYPAAQIVAGSRKPADLAEWAGRGMEVRRVDFDDVSSLADAFVGVQKMLLISTDTLDNAVRSRTQRQAVEGARKAGIFHIYYTSMPQPEDSLVSFASVHLGTEDSIKASGVTFTILRNNWYFENLLPNVKGALATGKLFSSASDGKIAYIARTDLARAAAAALIERSEVANRTFNLSGTEALNIDTVAAAFAKMAGKPIEVVQVSEADLINGMKSHGLPEMVATAVASFDAASKAGNLSAVTSDYESLTGASPETFASWLEENKNLLSS